MNGLELLKENPKACIVVKQWYLEKMLENLKDDSLPEDFKELVRQQGIDEEKIAVFIDASPRALFDVFDNHGLYIQISGHKDHWEWEVGSFLENTVCSSRKEAEKTAVEKAFVLLNDKL